MAKRKVQETVSVSRAVVGYARVSTEEQAQDGYGLAAQETRLRAYAEALGLTLADIITDDGFSGGKLDRPGLTALRARIESGEVGTVIIAKIDRLSRNLRDLLNLYADEFEAHNVALVSVAEQFDTSTPAGRLFFQMVGSFAEFERSIITDRLSGGRKQKATKGGYAGGRAPLGYSATKGSKALAVDEEGAAAVRRLFVLADEGLSNAAIADRLNAEGFKTAEGAQFHAMQVWRAVKRRNTYQGGYTFAGVHTEDGAHAAILPKVQAV